MFDEQKLAEMMQPVPHFAGLSQSDLFAILHAGTVRSFQGNTALFWEGEPCSGLFVILEGEVHLYKHGPEGQENIMEVIQPVTMFNEVAVLDGGENPATARAFSKSVVWQAEKEQFDVLLHTYSQIALALLPILARRNRRLVSQYEDMCFLPVRARTAKLLLELSRAGEVEIDRGIFTIQELAARISTSPEVVSRTLGLLTASGLIQTSRQSLSVIDPTGLSHQAFPNQDSSIPNPV